MTRPNDADRRLHGDLDALRRLDGRGTADGPPPAIDAAIREQARRAVRAQRTPRRWWVPASVAATALIALSLVLRVQQETTAPPATEELAASAPADTAKMPDEARDASVMSEMDMPQASESIDAAPGAAASAESAGAEPATTAPERPKAVAAPAPAATSPVAKESQADAPAIASDITAPPPPPAARSRAFTPSALPEVATGTTAAPELPRPEDWLARIEALEAAGRHDEALAERERLEAAYPGWLEARGATQQ